jgi:glycosyltransferase involved in cell wall biosynthesis
MRILFLEPFYGGSHQAFADGLCKYSEHQIDLVTLPGRLWKWRLRTGALTLAQQVGSDLGRYDLLFASDMLDLAAFKGLSGWQGPAVVYFHENQLSYPVPKGETPEPHFGFINLNSALVADACWFNSEFHRSQFFADLRTYYVRIPDDRPVDITADLQQKSRVVYPGVDTRELGRPGAARNPVPVILWNHRWEFDKRPEVFFAALYQLAEEGFDFRLILAGEGSQMMPKPFIEAQERFGDRVIHYGFAEDRQHYARLLHQADIVVSTAVQENFGMAIVEAVYCRTVPLLPRRLVYPEILPKEAHDLCLYSGRREMLEKLRTLLTRLSDFDSFLDRLSMAMERFAWHRRIEEFDRLFSEVVSVGAERRRPAQEKARELVHSSSA